MIPKDCKRLAEVDFPIAVVSKHAAREKSIRHGHPSTLHLWWARRPLAACRAMLLALLLPDPCDPACPDDFKQTARETLQGILGIREGDEGLRKALLTFIGDVANWDVANHLRWIGVARELVKAAHGNEAPLVVDPFAGGGSIPLEALRLGCEVFASDLNPVACLILKTMLEDIPRHGPKLAEELRHVGAEIKQAAEKELAEFYPTDPDGAKPIAYLWARTVRCEAPNCGAEIPLVRSFWLCKKASRRRALRYKVNRPVEMQHTAPMIEFEIFEPKTESEVPSGTVTRAKATCLCCGTVLAPDRVRAQLRAQRGGANVVFDEKGIGCIVFAHKTTEGWEALLSGMIKGGWVITGSWPITTELASRLRARESAALSASIHLVCRPRSEDAPVGDWNEVLRGNRDQKLQGLSERIGDWMERLMTEGVRGADLVFACIGPAMEVYSRYAKVEDAEGREIPLGGDLTASEPYKRGFLTYVWETVGRTALGQVLGTVEARARNGAAGALEEDARLTALFLWTLQASDVGANGTNSEEVEEEDLEDGEDAGYGGNARKKGFSLIYDVVRRFAQPLGIHLDQWEDRIIATEKGIVRLLPVAERAKQLFGKDGATAVADRLEMQQTGPVQLSLFVDDATRAFPTIKGRGRGKRSKSRVSTDVSDEQLSTRHEATTLDRVHAAMLLQASGRANALRALLKAEQDRGPDFLRLANALSALYPKESEEKRLLDAMLLAVPR